VKEWVFTYQSEEGREEDRSVKAAAAFLMKNRDLFPPGSLPSYPVQLAALAVRVYRVISEMTATDLSDRTPIADSAIAGAILEALRDDVRDRSSS